MTTVWIVHDENRHGHTFVPYYSREGAYAAVLATIRSIMEREGQGGIYADVWAAIRSGDGRAALDAFNALASEHGRERCDDTRLTVIEETVRGAPDEIAVVVGAPGARLTGDFEDYHDGLEAFADHDAATRHADWLESTLRAKDVRVSKLVVRPASWIDENGRPVERTP